MRHISHGNYQDALTFLDRRLKATRRSNNRSGSNIRMVHLKEAITNSMVDHLHPTSSISKTTVLEAVVHR